MISYRDMTFCQAKCANAECPRHWDAIKRAKAIGWWGGEDAPVAFSDFSKDCPEYQPEVAA